MDDTVTDASGALGVLDPWIREVETEDFLFRAPAHAVDAQRGLGIIWLASNDEWKKRVTERVSMPRIDTLDTTLQFDVDIAQIMRHGLPADQRDTYWLPLLSSRWNSPSVLEVLDEHGDRVPRLTTAEVRWYLAAGLAQLLVRTQPERVVQNSRRDVELLLAAAIRRCFTAALSGVDSDHSSMSPPEAMGIEVVRIDAEHDRRRTRDRLDVARRAVAGATWEASEVPDLVSSLMGRRLLVVECNRMDLRESYECKLPSRQLDPLGHRWVESSGSPEFTEFPEVADPVGSPGASTAFDAPPRPRDVPHLAVLDGDQRAARGWDFPRRSTEPASGGTGSRLLGWLRRKGPACGRAGLDIELIADGAAANYHVVFELPEGTQVPPPGMVSAPYLEMELDTHELVDRVVGAAERFVGLANSWLESTDGRNRSVEIQLERVAAEVSTASGNLRNLLRSVSSETQDLDSPESWSDLLPALGEIAATIVAMRVRWERAAFDTAASWASPFDPPPGEVDHLGLVGQCEALVAKLRAGRTAVLRKRYRQRDEGHPDRIHIAVPSADRAPRTIPTQASRLRSGVYLVEPMPHTTTNLANALNTGMILLAGAVISSSAVVSAFRPMPRRVPLEMSAVVAILILFAGVQAARLERPDRTTLRGWLSRMPYVLGFVSPIPSALLAVWVAGGGVAIADGWVRAGLVIFVFGCASVAQLVLVGLGIHAGREAVMWDIGPERGAAAVAAGDPVSGGTGGGPSVAGEPDGPPDERADDAGREDSVLSALLPRFVWKLLDRLRRRLLKRRTKDLPDALRVEEPQRWVPRARLLGELSRRLAPAGFWVTPAIQTSSPAGVEPGDGGGPSTPTTIRTDVQRLQSAPVRELLSEALVQVDATRQWHVVDLAMVDQGGTLGDILKAIEQGLEGEERLEYSAALGVSFAGYATMKLVLGGRSGTEIDTRFIRKRLEVLGEGTVPHVEVAPTALDVRNAPVRTVTQIFELMAHLSIDGAVAQVSSIAIKCRKRGLNLMLLHVPSSPPRGALNVDNPRMSDPRFVWLRVRIGVPHDRLPDFLDVIRDVTYDITADEGEAGALVRVSSVAEFARPSTGAQPGGEGGEHWLEVADRSATTGDGEVTFVFIDTPMRRGVMECIFTAVDELHKRPARRANTLRGASSYSLVGRSFTMLYFEGEPDADADRTWSIEKHIRVQLQRRQFLDATTMVRQRTLPGWPGVSVDDRARAGAGMRLVWQAPNVPGVLAAIMRTLRELPGQPNTSYVLSRVSDVDVSLGRLVLRLEQVQEVIDAATNEEDETWREQDQPTTEERELIALEDHARLLSSRLTRELERLVQIGRDDDPDRPLRERDVFVSTDLFRERTNRDDPSALADEAPGT